MTRGRSAGVAQLGCAGLILAIMALDSSVKFDTTPKTAPKEIKLLEPAEGDAAWLQGSLNAIGTTPALMVDGIAGAATRTAVRAFQKARGLRVDGIVGPKTIAVIKKGA